MSPAPAPEPDARSVPQRSSAPTLCGHALVDPETGTVRSDELLVRLMDTPGLALQLSRSAAGVLTGVSGGKELTVAGHPARLEAVRDETGHRRALLSVDLPHPGDRLESLLDWLGPHIEYSDALIWIKDGDGRTRLVNRRYRELLAIDAARVLGRRDDELRPGESVDGPRARSADEPVALEYMVPALERRPPLRALRCPLGAPGAGPDLILGLATPADGAEVTGAALIDAECDRLLALVAGLADPPDTHRARVLSAWGLEPEGGRPLPGELGTSDRGSAVSGFLPGDAPSPSLPPPSQHHADQMAPDTDIPQREAERERFLLEGRLTSLTEQLAASESENRDLRRALAAAQDQIVRLERAAAAATAAAARPVNVSSNALKAAHSAVAVVPTPPVPADVALPGRGPGWNPAAHTRLLETLRRGLDASSKVSEAIRCIGEEGRWDLVSVWVAGADDGNLRCTASWVGSDQMSELETRIWQSRPAGMSCLGRSAAEAQRAWLHPGSIESDGHLDELAVAGIHTAVLLPLGEPPAAAVLELTSRAHAAMTPAADAALASIQTVLADALAASAARPGTGDRGTGA